MHKAELALKIATAGNKGRGKVESSNDCQCIKGHSLGLEIEDNN